MKYFRIRHSIETKVIGRKYPQVERVLIPTQWDSPLFLESFSNRKAPTDVQLPQPILYKSSKITDLISAATVGLSLKLLVSERLKTSIEKSQCYGVQFFPVKLNHKNSDCAYWILHPFNFAYEQLNLDKSVVGYYYDLNSKKIAKELYFKNHLAVENEVHAYDARMQNDKFDGKFLIISNIVCNELGRFDFFALRCITGGTGFFVSEKLKREIETMECTGVVFTEPNQLYP